jgi:hypothetical protein
MRALDPADAQAFAQQAPAQMVKGEATANFENGFVRLVFTLAEDVESRVRTGNGIIIVSFQRPVVMSLDKLAAGSNGFISAARRDPDGKGCASRSPRRRR